VYRARTPRSRPIAPIWRGVPAKGPENVGARESSGSFRVARVTTPKRQQTTISATICADNGRNNYCFRRVYLLCGTPRVACVVVFRIVSRRQKTRAEVEVFKSRARFLQHTTPSLRCGESNSMVVVFRRSTKNHRVPDLVLFEKSNGFFLKKFSSTYEKRFDLIIVLCFLN